MATYRNAVTNYYTDKMGSYAQIGSITPVLANNWTETSSKTHHAHYGYLYCDGSSYPIRDYPMLYEKIGNNYMSPLELIDANSFSFTSAGGQSTIYRTFVDGTDVYAEIYKNTYSPVGSSTTYSYQAIPNQTNMRFIGGLGDYPSGGTVFEADKDYVLNYSETYQSLAARNDTTVHRFLINAAATSDGTVTVNWGVTSQAIVPTGGQYPTVDVEYYGTVPYFQPGTLNPATGLPYPTGYDEYTGAENDSPDLYWGNMVGLPSGVVVDTYEIYLQDMSQDNYVQWHITGIPSNIISMPINGAAPTGSTVVNNWLANSTILPLPGTIAGWIRDNGYSGPQPDSGEKHIYRLNILARLNNGQTLITHKDFTAGTGNLIPIYPTNTPTYEDNYVITGVSSGINNNVFNVDMASLPVHNNSGGVISGHPKIRFRKNYFAEDFPIVIGNFKVPDYRQRKLIGYGEGVNGAGSPLVEARATVRVGDVGGEWQIRASRIDDPAEFFTISDVQTTGYSDVTTQIQPYITGKKEFTVGPIGDYIFARPVEHQHYLLNSQTNSMFEASLGGVDSFTTAYRDAKGGVLNFFPSTADEIPLGHAHGLTNIRPTNAVTSTYGNSAGIGDRIEDPNNPGCYLYRITEPPTVSYSSITLDGTIHQ